MPFAANGQISTTNFDGAIKISQAQYDEALEGMLSGKLVVVDSGFAVIDPPETEPEPAPPPLTPEEALAAWRETTSISRAEFCINANKMGLLPDADAELAADGTWPQTFDAFIASLPLEERIRARADWADNPRIRRMAPTLLKLAENANLTPEQIDLLCGWTG